MEIEITTKKQADDLFAGYINFFLNGAKASRQVVWCAATADEARWQVERKLLMCLADSIQRWNFQKK
jgi:hypothetical protein